MTYKSTEEAKPAAAVKLCWWVGVIIVNESNEYRSRLHGSER